MKLVATLVLGFGCVAAHAQAASDVFPNIPYTSITRPTMLKPSGPANSGKTASLMMGDSGSCNTAESGYCERSSDTYSGGGWTPLESYEKVVIYGKSTRDTSICYGEDCRQYMRSPDQVMEISPVWLKEKIIEKTVGENRADACSAAQSSLANAEQKNILQSTTSQGGAEDRQVAARAAMQASGLASYLSGKFATSNLIHKWAYGANGGYTVNVVFSDGGSEQYKWALLVDAPHNPTVIPNTLKKGSGESRCPAN